MAAVLHGGFCFGILDPISNIIANAISGSIGQPAAWTEETATEAQSLEGMARRSLDGLVAFLISYFRYLPTDEALRYLRAAKADIRAAVQLIESDRCAQAFRVDSGTARTALRCAALAARHPDPDHLVTVTLTIFSCLHKVPKILSKPGRLSAAAVERLRRILDEYKPQLRVMETAASRLPERARALGVPSSSRQLSLTITLTYSLKRVLLDRIHGLYLEAIALLPAERLRSHYHRSLTIAGHCYGPLDPVSNVVLHTVWLEATFPVPEEQQLDLPMISSLALLRLQICSLEGMVAFLRAFAGGDLSDLDACWFLLYADANLHKAMKALKKARAKPKGHPFPKVPLSDDSDLYQAAVTAALHPRPDMARDFLTSGRVCAMLPAYSGRLTLKDVRSLIISLSGSETKLSIQNDGLPLLPAKYQRMPRLPRISFTSNKKEFQRELNLLSRMVEAALKEYTQHNPGTEYELVFICGGNGCVADDCGPELGNVDWPRSVFKYHYCHVNFLARPRGSDVAPTLFFAECVKQTSDLARKTTCCPVVVPPTYAAEELRCFYCEYQGANIVHPTERNYHGCDTDFQKLALGKHMFMNEKIIYTARCRIEYMSLLPVDFVYFDPEA